MCNTDRAIKRCSSERLDMPTSQGAFPDGMTRISPAYTNGDGDRPRMHPPEDLEHEKSERDRKNEYPTPPNGDHPIRPLSLA